MKFEFEKVYVKNFLSIGANPIILEYQKGVHAVMGKVIGSTTTNGVGKSTLFSDAVIFGLYGKSIRGVKMDNLVNSINEEECVVKVWLKINDIPYRIERGIKPGFLKIYKNDNDEAQELSKPETQKKLDKILSISYTSFKNLITLNINSSKPFFDMKADEKRFT
jgi:DNA repair exonuclease SbcCD ATPase subunit